MSDSPHILVVDDKESMRQMLQAALEDMDLAVTTASCGEKAIEELGKTSFDIVLTDLNMPGKNGMDVLKAAKSLHSETQVIMITAYGTIETAVEAMRLGAHDFIAKPFKLDEIERKINRILKAREQGGGSRIQTWIHPSVQTMVGTSQQTRQLMKMIMRLAPSKSSVLITGPSGVGKELAARAIHEASPRRDKPFVALNCAALAPGILESELFGHEKGAFTGAADKRIGHFEKADTGTLFLDEVGEIDPGIQVKLLRFLQEGEIERVGGTQTIRVDVRIVAATNRDLHEAIEKGDFRKDFFYRLNVFSLQVPPLRERRDDIPALLDHFLRKFSMEMSKNVFEIDDEVIGAFLNYPWPGNVRELENVIERAVVLAEGDSITRNDLPPELLQVHDPEPYHTQSPSPGSLADHTDKMERDIIQQALEQFRWNKTKTAEHLGLKRTTLQYKIKKYELE